MPFSYLAIYFHFRQFVCVFFINVNIINIKFFKRKNLFVSHFMSVIPFVRLSVFFCNTAEIWNANVVLFYFLTALYKFKHKTLLKCMSVWVSVPIIASL